MAPLGQTVKPEFQRYIRAVMSGAAAGIAPTTLRAALSLAEPLYASATILRNRLYDAGAFAARRLSRPVISIGNITTGGTGKTPMVRWLSERLRDDGHRVAILSRGYGAPVGGAGDELLMLQRLLNDPAASKVWLRASPNRVAAGHALLAQHPEIDVFVLDDGFQHRRAARDLDVVLISALEPFGFGHMLPRGLLREPLRGVRRAGAVVITHADEVPFETLSEIERQVRRHHPGVPTYRAIHTQIGLRASSAPEQPMDELSRRRFFAFCGLANPEALDRQLSRFGQAYIGRRWFADHHDYTAADLERLTEEARRSGAELLVTTEKDWVKVEPIAASPDRLPIWPIDMRIRFLCEDEERLLEQIRGVIPSRPTSS